MQFIPAKTYRVADYQDEIEALKLMIGEFMSDNPIDWARHCWVSDLSQLSDFSPSHEDVSELSGKLGFAVGRMDYLVVIAAMMRRYARQMSFLN